MSERTDHYYPPNGVFTWVDDWNIYYSVPMADRQGNIIQQIKAYPNTVAGLKEAMAFLKGRFDALPPGTVVTPFKRTAARPQPKVKPQKPEVGTLSQRSAVMEILKKRGMIR